MTDYISRQALLKDIEEYHVSDGEFQHWVEVQPSALVREVKRGRWIPHKDYPGLAWLCSECNLFTTDRSYYCPRCGTEMEEE